MIESLLKGSEGMLARLHLIIDCILVIADLQSQPSYHPLAASSSLMAHFDPSGHPEFNVCNLPFSNEIKDCIQGSILVCYSLTEHKDTRH
jgi:hypothetical protein